MIILIIQIVKLSQIVQKTLNKQTDKKWELFVNNCINFVEVL